MPADGVALRNAGYDRSIRRVHRVGVPVISVGNLTTGGTGKTPITRVLASRLASIGERPAILLRGYRARGDPDPVPSWDLVPPHDGLARYGDEALAHARETRIRPRRTWGPWHGAPRCLRIDHVFASGGRPLDCRTLPVPGSDHSAVLVDIEL